LLSWRGAHHGLLYRPSPKRSQKTPPPTRPKKKKTNNPPQGRNILTRRGFLLWQGVSSTKKKLGGISINRIAVSMIRGGEEDLKGKRESEVKRERGMGS